MSSKLVVVQEAPPTLETLSSGKIRVFLKAYRQYYQRYRKTEESPSMRQLISITNLTVMKSLHKLDKAKVELPDVTFKKRYLLI